MNYIFLDLEFNRPIGYRNPRLGFEIMEIGAVKTDEDLNVIDTFRIYIKNTIYKSINRYVTKITGITVEDLKYGFVFTDAYKIFRNWIGEEEFKVFSYSDSDGTVLNANLKYYKINSKEFSEIIDVQNEIMIKMNMSRHPSLKDLCAIYEIDIDESKIHEALFDTIMLVDVYKKFLTSKYTVLELRNKVDEKYKDLFDTMLKISFEEAKSLDKRRYKVTCPSCRSQLKKKSINYHIKSSNIHAYSRCEKCSQNVAMIFRVRKDIITGEIKVVKATYANSFKRESNKYLAIK